MVAHANPFGRKFSLGQIVVTTGALSAIASAGQMPDEFVMRHVRGDWGDLGKDDKALNDEACKYEGDVDRQGRILSSYQTTKGTKVWVITEFDRSVTTVLLPEEY